MDVNKSPRPQNVASEMFLEGMRYLEMYKVLQVLSVRTVVVHFGHVHL